MWDKVVRWRRSRFRVKWSGRIDCQLWCWSWGTWLGYPLLGSIRNEIRRGTTSLQNSKDCAWRSHPSPGLIILLNQNLSPNSSPEAQRGSARSSPTSLEASGLLPALPTL